MVHPLTLKEFAEVNYKYIDTAHDLAEKDFNNWCKLSGRQPNITINHITRVKTPKVNPGDPEEFLTWGEHRMGFDHVGNEKSFTEDRMGSYQFPIFNRTWDTRTNTITATAITKKETRYDTPYTPDKLQELYSMADKVNCKFYVRTGGNRYTVRYFNDFESGKYEDLIELGQSKFTTLQELLNARQTMVPVSMIDRINERTVERGERLNVVESKATTVKGRKED
jgi:hypothetical protein